MWRESLRIGVDSIDSQHKVLFEKIGELLQRIQRPETDSRKEYASIISFLKDYAVMHFTEEEAYQRSIGYKDHAAHKQLHAKFIASVLDHEKRLVSSDFANKEVREFTGMLLAWLLHHVADVDQGIANEVKKPGILSTLSEMTCESIRDVFHKMAEIDPGSIKNVENHGETFGESLIFETDLTGDITGYITILYPLELVRNLVYSMTRFRPDAIGELEISTLFEMSDIISRSICSHIARKDGISCDSSTPVITHRLDVAPDERVALDTGIGIIEADIVVNYS